ncbi:MAG TPA: type IV secretory system conjugative DNA transfer family protein, partial [Nitrospira sp.]|nr:type IV secretory system conjugative DNA transfer family protein [Nitrospira sp.]
LMITHSNRNQREASLGDSPIILLLMLFVVAAVGLYLVVARLHIRRDQLIESALYLFIICAAFTVPIVRKFAPDAKRKRRPPFIVQAAKDERAVADAWERNAVVLGYDMDEKPWLWPDEVRVMQGIVLGMTGSGKTTLLKNIITQDVARWIGPAEDRHRIPMVIFDGKGDLEFFEQLLPHIHRAARLHQLRLLNPSRPDQSVLYNPFFTRDDNYMAQVNMIFGSFNLHDEFFAKHQLNYLGDVVRVLFYTGARYAFYDVIVMLLDEAVLHEQIEKATRRLDRDAKVSAQQRLNFEMSVKNLLQSLEDRERVPKIQGLINECMTFLDDELSAITGQYDDLLSIEDVIDQELILFVSLNANKNIEPVRSLGKMLLQNIQLTVGKRYEDQAERRRQNRPIFSVVLDEFAPFGYRNFAQILQTARGTNTAFLFSMQSLPQLMQVGRGFKEEVTSAPNTTMTLRTRDEETAKYFIKASAEQTVVRRSIFKQRGFFGLGKYEETGRATETEDRETRSQDESIKNLPKGRMEILMSEDSRGTLYSLLQVRPPEDVSIPDFVPAMYPRMVQSRAQSSGANLRFKDPELERKYRVPGRYAGGSRR